MTLKPLPPKIEGRLRELVQMSEFDQGDVAHCRRAYWSARDDWHKILIDCYDMAKARAGGGVLFMPARDEAPRRAFVEKQQQKETA